MNKKGQITLILGMIILLVAGGTVYYIASPSETYFCEDNNLTAMCYKLESPDNPEISSRCFYNESLDKNYLFCKSGWTPVSKIESIKDTITGKEIIPDDASSIIGKVSVINNEINATDFMMADQSKYSSIQLINLSTSKKISEYKITSITSICGEKCEMVGKAKLDVKSRLFDDAVFEKAKINSYNFYIREPNFTSVCQKYNETEGCIMVQLEGIPNPWRAYNYGELDAGEYEWKLNGTKGFYDTVDAIPISNGLKFDEWADWGAGGTITHDGLYTVHTFLANGTFNFTGDMNVTVLVVAGGGGGAGGAYLGGGGGAGGLLYNDTFYMAYGNYTITVGGGGSRPTDSLRGKNGDNSSITNGSTLFFAIGGGGGGDNDVPDGAPGGSGGGGAGEKASNGGLGTPGQGNNGGKGYQPAGNGGAGGGGGAGLVGQDAQGQVKGGDGGNGTNYTINGTNVWYAGGGGGSCWNGAAACGNGTGGYGGGGNGSCYGGQDGIAGTGGGGGGAERCGGQAGNGGSGVVIIRYLTNTNVFCNFSGYVKNSAGTGINGSIIIMINQSNPTIVIANTTSGTDGNWTISSLFNYSANYTVIAYYNNTLLGQAKPFISGLC